jgi:acetyl-CoA C-acetyltransferase
VAPTVEGGRQEEVDDLVGQAHTDDASADGEHVGVVVCSGHASGVEVVAQRSAHATHLVGGELLALAAPAEHDARIGSTVAYGTTHCGAEDGIVDALGGIGAEVGDLVALSTKPIDEIRLELEPGVVGPDGDTCHPGRVYADPNSELSTRSAFPPIRAGGDGFRSLRVMSLDPRTPVVIGVGQFVHHAAGIEDALEPLALMAEAIDRAAADAGLASIPRADSLRVVSLLSWRYGNPPLLLAQRLGLSPRELAYTTPGGNTPQSLVNATAGQIAAGELDVAILTGGEAFRTRIRAKKAGVELGWPHAPDDAPPELIGSDLKMNMEAELDRKIFAPVQIYPMFETAIRAARGADPSDHLDDISELWARFSEVAAGNPHAWIRETRTAAEIRTPGPRNRMIGLPYPKMMNSNNDVDMAAAVIMCSVDAARRLGVAEDRWVFPHSGTDCHEHPFVSIRQSFSRTPAVELGGQRALQLAGVGIDDVSIIDLYSCFPAAVQLGARSLGLDPYDADRQLTRTGGLTFAGGPWNNYVMHAIATVVTELRERPGERGLVWANGGYVTKHAFGVYSSDPPADGFRHESPQDAIDALPRRELASGQDAAGAVSIEAYTVMHDRDGLPERTIATCLLDDGRRAWGTSVEPDVHAAIAEGEWVGRRATLTVDGSLDLT